MREILFRGKREDTGEWVEGYYVLKAILLGTIEEEVYPQAPMQIPCRCPDGSCGLAQFAGFKRM